MEIREAQEMFPSMEMGEAYRRWKELRGEEPTFLTTGDPTLEATKAELRISSTKPCSQEGCGGKMILESICSSCVEGRAGYKSKWTCSVCLHRELSKQDYMECLKELSG